MLEPLPYNKPFFRLPSPYYQPFMSHRLWCWPFPIIGSSLLALHYQLFFFYMSFATGRFLSSVSFYRRRRCSSTKVYASDPSPFISLSLCGKESHLSKGSQIEFSALLLGLPTTSLQILSLPPLIVYAAKRVTYLKIHTSNSRLCCLDFQLRPCRFYLFRPCYFMRGRVTYQKVYVSESSALLLALLVTLQTLFSLSLSQTSSFMPSVSYAGESLPLMKVYASDPSPISHPSRPQYFMRGRINYLRIRSFAYISSFPPSIFHT